MVEDTRKLGTVKVLMVKGQDGESTPIATTSVAGKVKPDGTTITVEQDGTIKGKLAPVFTIGDTLVRISSSAATATRVHVSVSSGAWITATSSDTSVATIAASTTITGELDIDITSVAAGACCIELSVNASGIYSAAKAYINVEVYAESGGGSSIRKTRYTISSSSWSASANASGYYTYSVTLNPTLVTTQPPDVSIAGSTDSTVWTDAQKAQYDLVDYYDNTATNTLVLYAKTKPTANFYIWVKGEVA